MGEPTSSAAGVQWDLGDLFAGPDDPAIQNTLSECKRDAEEFAARYRGTVAVAGGPSPEHLLECVRRLENIVERVDRVHSYAGLLFAADTANPRHRDLQQKVEQRVTELENILLFFDLEWLELGDDDASRLIEHPVLATYRHHLRGERRYRPHKLTELEEKIVNEKDVTGTSAWRRLFTELISSLSFPVEIEGQTRSLTESQTLALLHSPDRGVRQRAHDSLFDVLAEHGQILTYVYDTLIQDRLTMDRLRQYPDPMASRHLANEIDAESVARMMDVAEANYGIAQEYFRMKFDLLKIADPKNFDQYAPVNAHARQIPFADARAIILDALQGFAPKFRGIAAEFFEKSWIDAELRPGKRGGAFCASPSPSLHPYILCNYTDNARDAMTVAHELGHGLHGYLSLGQSPFNYHPTLPMAETASVFAEILVFDHLVKREDDPSAQLALVANKIEDVFATVFRQNVLTRFEQAAFKARSSGSRLTSDKLSDEWIEANSRYYADSLELAPGYRWGWSYIPHFIQTPFYCYSYVFGELLVLALYGMYREQRQAFVPKYVSLLQKGGSGSPEELLAGIGIDFHDPSFWQRGFGELSRLVGLAKSLASQVSRA